MRMCSLGDSIIRSLDDSINEVILAVRQFGSVPITFISWTCCLSGYDVAGSTRTIQTEVKGQIGSEIPGGQRHFEELKKHRNNCFCPEKVWKDYLM